MFFEVLDFNERNLSIIGKLLGQGFHYHKLHKTVTKLFHEYKDLVGQFAEPVENFMEMAFT